MKNSEIKALLASNPNAELAFKPSKGRAGQLGWLPTLIRGLTPGDRSGTWRYHEVKFGEPGSTWLTSKEAYAEHSRRVTPSEHITNSRELFTVAEAETIVQEAASERTRSSEAIRRQRETVDKLNALGVECRHDFGGQITLRGRVPWDKLDELLDQLLAALPEQDDGDPHGHTAETRLSFHVEGQEATEDFALGELLSMTTDELAELSTGELDDLIRSVYDDWQSTYMSGGWSLGDEK
jgi:hypothetical protein